MKALVFSEDFMDTVKIKKKGTRLIAHRGLSGIECENTAAAFVAAGNRDYFGIETDIHRTADGKFIVIHDDTTARVSLTDLSVESSDYDTLRTVRLRDKDGLCRGDLCLPSAEEYFRICKKYGKTAVTELKNKFAEEDIISIADIARREYSLDRVIFISFVYENLIALKNYLPNVSAQLLYRGRVNDELTDKLKRYGLDLDIRYDRLTKKNISLLHSLGIKVNCWTCDDRKDADTLAGWGIDYITTNILQ